MSSDFARSLADQREELRDRMRAQRERIALELAPADPSQVVFPRSMTMRLLIRRPDLIARLLMAATRLIRSR